MNDTRRITEIAILVALAIVIELAFTWVPKMPQGGSVSIATLPIFILAYRHGLKWGLIGGAVYGMLSYMFFGVFYHWASVVLDYGLAFSVIGFAGIFRLIFKDTVWTFSLGVILGNILRFIVHVISGVVVFGEFAGNENVYWYSITYNATYILPSMIFVLIVGFIVYFPIKQVTENS